MTTCAPRASNSSRIQSTSKALSAISPPTRRRRSAARRPRCRSGGPAALEAHQVAERIGQGDDLRAPAAARAADGLALSPPFAPCPWRWTLTMLPSPIANSRSGSPDRASNIRLKTSAIDPVPEPLEHRVPSPDLGQVPPRAAGRAIVSWQSDRCSTAIASVPARGSRRRAPRPSAPAARRSRSKLTRGKIARATSNAATASATSCIRPSAFRSRSSSAAPSEPVDPGVAVAAEAAGLDRGRVRLERLLRIAARRPARDAPSRPPPATAPHHRPSRPPKNTEPTVARRLRRRRRDRGEPAPSAAVDSRPARRR